MDNNLTEQLKVGFPAIDQMRAEIDLIAGRICGLITKADLREFGGRVQGIFKSGAHDWYIVRSLSLARDPDGPVIHATCWGVRENQTRFIVYSTQEHAARLEDQDVQKVWETLPVFVDGIINTFPNLLGRLQPYLDAAQALHPSPEQDC